MLFFFIYSSIFFSLKQKKNKNLSVIKKDSLLTISIRLRE